MKINFRFWLIISLINLLIISILGVLMRYKIGFEFPFFDQKSIQHAHSHFAFVGWVAHTLYVLMLAAIQQEQVLSSVKKYRLLIIANLICSYGMLICFFTQGYTFPSILFSSLSILVSYLFAFHLFRELKQGNEVAYKKWFRAALWFNIISSLGTFALVYHIARHIFDQKIHLSSLYFYLHFQYNGFFTFACFGLFISQLPKLLPSYIYSKRIFNLLSIACIFSYLLSVLWLNLPLWIMVIVVVAAFMQVIAWSDFLKRIWVSLPDATQLFKSGKLLFLIVALALSVKFLLQLGSTIPAISKLAFGFRPIVIAYLHLILLAIISVFLIAYIYVMKLIQVNVFSGMGILIFIVGVYLNELILGVQGIASFSYTVIPMANEYLFAASLIIFIGLLFLLGAQFVKPRNILAK